MTATYSPRVLLCDVSSNTLINFSESGVSACTVSTKNARIINLTFSTVSRARISRCRFAEILLEHFDKNSLLQSDS
jgi:hypothetical protein